MTPPTPIPNPARWRALIRARNLLRRLPGALAELHPDDRAELLDACPGLDDAPHRVVESRLEELSQRTEPSS